MAKVIQFPKIEKPVSLTAVETSEADDFGDRMQRIKTSLKKLNQLMTELKKMTQE